MLENRGEVFARQVSWDPFPSFHADRFSARFHRGFLLKVPVALIVFRRPDLTGRVLQSIQRYQPNRLYLIADGARADVESDKDLVDETRALFENLEWDCELVRVFSDKNLGLRDRVLSGLDFVFSHEESAIILEDDCVPDYSFFKFAEELLERYSGQNEVALVSANNFGFLRGSSNRYFFSAHAHIWGWATWRATWEDFRSKSSERFVGGGEIDEIFDLIPTRGKRAAMRRMLQIEENLDSWALNFSVFCYQNLKLAAVPKVNLASNIGFGASSTHTKFESYADQVPAGELKFPLKHPDTIYADLLEMKLEAMGKGVRWITYPLAHPFDFLGRIMRYIKLLKGNG